MIGYRRFGGQDHDLNLNLATVTQMLCYRNC